MNFTKDTSVWDKIKKEFLKSQKASVDVGFWPEDRYGPDNGNLQMAQNAQWQNEGVVAANIPARPFMSVGLGSALRDGKNDAQFKSMVVAVLKGESILTPMKASTSSFEDTLKDVMYAWKSPMNAPLTVELKNFNDPLIETEQLVQSVKAKVRAK